MGNQAIIIEPSAQDALPNPFDADGDQEALYGVSRRGLVRLAIVATRVGARFERDGVDADPAAWLQTPRRAFDGEAALTACLRLRPFERAIVLHAPDADLGFDAEPDFLDGLLDDEGDEEAPGPVASASCALDGAVLAQPRHDPIPPAARRRQPEGGAWRDHFTGERLFCAGFSRYDGWGRVLCFVAAVVQDEREFRNRVFERFGAIAALGVRVQAGFDRRDRYAVRLVSESAAFELERLALSPDLPTIEGFAFAAEQRA